jgi:hypothetical protein
VSRGHVFHEEPSEITPARRFAPTSPIEGEVNFMRGSNNLPPR